MDDVDVVIVGASLAGCTAATLYGRAGLRVALLEKHRSAQTAKALCGHFILAGTQPTLQRLGLRQQMLAAGAVEAPLAIHAGGRWLADPDPDLPLPISLRRSKLDPMVREMAATTPGVTMLLGHTVTDFVRRNGRIAGVRARTVGGKTIEVLGRLVVGADGYRSQTASLAGVPEDVMENGRGGLFAYYEGITATGPGVSQVWAGQDVGIHTPTDDGLSLVGVFPRWARGSEFRDDPDGAVVRFMAALPDPLDFTHARRVSRFSQAWTYPQIRRNPTPRPGLALIGDAATTGDPVPAVGCGWAFRSAEWLADTTADALRTGRGLPRALARYRRAHRFIDTHDDLCREESTAAPPPRPAQLIMAAAADDRRIRRNLYRVRMRAAPVSAVRNPVTLARAAWTLRRSRTRLTAV